MQLKDINKDHLEYLTRSYSSFRQRNVLGPGLLNREDFIRIVLEKGWEPWATVRRRDASMPLTKQNMYIKHKGYRSKNSQCAMLSICGVLKSTEEWAKYMKMSASAINNYRRLHTDKQTADFYKKKMIRRGIPLPKKSNENYHHVESPLPSRMQRQNNTPPETVTRSTLVAVKPSPQENKPNLAPERQQPVQAAPVFDIAKDTAKTTPGLPALNTTKRLQILDILVTAMIDYRNAHKASDDIRTFICSKAMDSIEQTLEE